MSIRKSVDSPLRKFESDFVTHNVLEVSRSALLHNLGLFTELSGKQATPILKGNDYGHGIRQVANVGDDAILSTATILQM
jgi:alanine racemase